MPTDKYCALLANTANTVTGLLAPYPTTPTGVEQPSHSFEKRTFSKMPGTESGTLAPELLEIAQEWEALPNPIRQAILAIIRSQQP